MVGTGQIRDALAAVKDPETQAPIIRLGQVEDVAVNDDGTVEVRFRPISPYTPPMLVAKLALEIAAAVAAVEGIAAVRVTVAGHPLDRYLNAALEKVLAAGKS